MFIYKSFKIRINKHHKLYDWCKTVCTESKGIIDYATYIRRQNFFEGKKTGKYHTEKELSKQFRDTVYKRQLGHTALTTTIWNKTRGDWNSFFALIKKDLKARIPKYLKNRSKYGYIEYHVGPYNIMRKAFPNVTKFSEHGIEGFIVDPIRTKNPYELGMLLHEGAYAS